jgi:hypothetical protein
MLHTSLMSLLCDYFMAPTSQAAASVLDWVGGPAHPPAGKRSLLRRAQPAEPAYEVVSLPGVEPTVTLGQLDALMTRRSISDVIRDPDRNSIASADGGERMVVPLGPRFEKALAATRDDHVPELARQWSQAEEFGGQANPEILADGIRELASLVRRGQDRQEHLYCWVCV